MAGLKTGILWPDTHAPYHDVEAVRIAMQAVRKIKPDYLVLLGDFADFYSVSSHDKDPGRREHDSLDWEVNETNVLLDEIGELPAKEIIYCQGNHEQRLERYIAKNAPELFGTVTCKNLFEIEQRGWRWVPYRQHISIGKLHLTHDYGRHGKYCAQQTLDAFQHNIAFGHSHRASIYYSGNLAGDKHVSASLGWLGDPEQVDYMHKAQLREWTQGIGYFSLEDSGNVHLQFLPIIEGKMVVPTKCEVLS